MGVIPMHEKGTEPVSPISQAHALAISLQWSVNGLAGTRIFGQPREMVSSVLFFLICQKADDCQSQVERRASLQPLVKCPGR